MASRPQASSSRSSGASSERNVLIGGKWQRLGEVGKGSFAMVYKGISTVSSSLLDGTSDCEDVAAQAARLTVHAGCVAIANHTYTLQKRRALVAIKSVQLFKLNKKLRENLTAEINILQSLRHPHIVGLIDCHETTEYIHIVMEYCEMGDLSQFIKGRSSLASHEATEDMMRKYPNPQVGGLNEVVARHFLKQMASALEFLHSKNYVHRDIKPQNLLLVPSPLWYAKHKPDLMPYQVAENSLIPAAGVESLPMLKIADFGFARVLPQTSLAETLCGSPLYMAPEILRYEKYNAKADLWSVGTVLHEMMVGKPPFRANNHVELLRKIEKNEDRIKFPEGTVISSGMKALIRGLLKKSPTERMGFEAFFNDIVVKEDIPGLAEEDRPHERDMSASSKRLQKQPEMQPDEAYRETAQGPSRTSQRDRQGSVPQQQPEAASPRPSSHAQALPTSRTPSQRSPRSERPPTQRQTTPQDVPVSQQRRPSLVPHATAPAKPGHDRSVATAATAGAYERRNSRNTPSPSTSYPKDHPDRERLPYRDDRALREAREKAAQEVAFERDYVVVEKKSVEVNALADELAHSPQIRGGLRPQPLSPQHGAMIRRATTQGHPTSQTGAANTPSKAIQIATGNRRPDYPTHVRAGSYERRYGPNPSSATSAISKALNLATNRLFGMGLSPPGAKGISPPHGYGAFPTYPTAQGHLLAIGGSPKISDQKDEDSRTVLQCEDLATRSDVIYGFAEVKYKQLLPATPSNDGGILGLGAKRAGQAEPEEDDDLTVDAVIAISEEALVLYVKALAALAKVMDIAGTWWGHKNRGEVVSESPRSTLKPHLTAMGVRMNNVVQWSRNRFNECYDKSEFVGRKLQEAQKQLPPDHPSHPDNHAHHPTASSRSANSIGTTSAEDIKLTTGVTAEKLMYERACEMSRAAAVNELVNEDLDGCEIAYRTAVLMLEAVLDTDDVTSSRKGSESRKVGRAEDEAINGLEGEDRASIQSSEFYPSSSFPVDIAGVDVERWLTSEPVLDSTRMRLKYLKKKLEMQKAAKRTSPTPSTALPSRSPGAARADTADHY